MHFHIRTLKTAVWRFEYRANKTLTRVKLEWNLEVLYMPTVGEKNLHRNKSRRKVIFWFWPIFSIKNKTKNKTKQKRTRGIHITSCKFWSLKALFTANFRLLWEMLSLILSSKLTGITTYSSLFTLFHKPYCIQSVWFSINGYLKEIMATL